MTEVAVRIFNECICLLSTYSTDLTLYLYYFLYVRSVLHFLDHFRTALGVV